MPIFDFKCQLIGCELFFESTTPVCPLCGGGNVKKLIGYRQTKTTFSEKLFPFYHQGLGEVVHSEAHMNKRCEAAGLYSKHEGAYMTPRHERRLLSKRLDNRPREVVEKATWSGRGAGMPVFETVDTETGQAPEPESSHESE